MASESSALRVDNEPRQGRRLFKRVLEAVAVALPALFMLAGMILLPGSLQFGTQSWLFIVGVLVLAAVVLTQHWVAYALVLAAGIAFLFSSGLLVLAAWVFGAIYLAVSLVNLVTLVKRRRSGLKSEHGEVREAN